MLENDVSSSSSSEIFHCDMNMHHTVIGYGTYSVVIKPFVNNVKELLFENSYENDNKISKYVAKIYTEHYKEEFDKELAILQKISHIENYTDFTVPIKCACSFDISELSNEIEILHRLKTDPGCKKPSNTLYQIVLGYGGISLNLLHTEYSYITLSFGTFMSIMREFYAGIHKLHKVGIIHRDIKPVNLLFDNKRLSIIDFSISCDVTELYTNDPDQMYILSYMYMYNAPEFYIAYLMITYQGQGIDFKTNLLQTFNKMASYSKDLETFYEEHYYRYNKSEPYNIFSYQQSFSKFYDMILEQNITSMADLFTKEMAFKSDVYSTYFILKELKKYIIFENILQKHIFNTLCDMTSAINPFQRSSITQILNYIDDNLC